MNISFKGQNDIERQVRQIMRESSPSIESKILEHCRTKIDSEFRDEFAKI